MNYIYVTIITEEDEVVNLRRSKRKVKGKGEKAGNNMSMKFPNLS